MRRDRDAQKLVLIHTKRVYGSFENQTCEEIQGTLCRALAHQLDWSLDDLELDSTDRQIVDEYVDFPAPDVEI